MIKGKNIVITGANSGIGLETLKLLANGDNTIRFEKRYPDGVRRFHKRKRGFDFQNR